MLRIWCLVQAAEQGKKMQQELQSVKDRAEKQEAAMAVLEQSLRDLTKVCQVPNLPQGNCLDVWHMGFWR